MKILFVSTGLFPGGEEKIVLELVRSLSAGGHCCTVVSLLRRPGEKEQTIVEALEKTGAKVLFLNAGRFQLFSLFALRRIVQEEKADVIHGHLMHGNLASRFAAWGRNIPVVNTVHIAEKRTSLKVRILFLLDRLTRKKCTLYTAVSHAAARFHEKKLGLEPHTIEVIQNGSNPVQKASEQAQQIFRKKYHLEDVQKIIGAVGRLDFQKGYDIFFNTLEDLHTLIPQNETWAILLMGDGPEKEKLIRLGEKVRQRCPRLRIVLTGYLPDAAGYLPLLDLFVMPSRYEGYGLALTEAVSCGIPCLCSQADSLPEICALVPENTLCASFCPGEMIPVYEKALAMPRTEGKILCDCETMAGNYLRFYTRLTRKKESFS